MKTPVERKFFKISQFFFFVVTSISLVTAFGLGLYGLYLHNASPQERFTQPTPSYERLKRERAQAKAAVEQAKAQQQAPATPQGDKTPPANPEAIPAEYLDVLNSIEKSIVSFANKAQQLSPGNKLRFRIYKAATQYTAHFSVSSLLAQLDVEAKALEADADRIRALPQTAPDYITWALFLDDYFAQIDSSIAAQRRSIAQEREQVMLKKAQSGVVFYTAAIALGVFIFFTMFLVVLSMEKNTYVLSCIQENLEKHPDADDPADA